MFQWLHVPEIIGLLFLWWAFFPFFWFFILIFLFCLIIRFYSLILSLFISKRRIKLFFASLIICDLQMSFKQLFQNLVSAGLLLWNIRLNIACSGSNMPQIWVPLNFKTWHFIALQLLLLQLVLLNDEWLLNGLLILTLIKPQLRIWPDCWQKLFLLCLPKNRRNFHSWRDSRAFLKLIILLLCKSTPFIYNLKFKLLL